VELTATDLVDPWVRAWTVTMHLRRRDFLAPLTWEQWCAWQAWAVCGCRPRGVRSSLIADAQAALLASLMRADLDEPKRDARVPVLTEADLIRALDDEHLRLWLSHYVRGRSLRYLARRRGLALHGLHLRLANARAVVALLLPADAIGLDLAYGETRLTLV